MCTQNRFTRYILYLSFQVILEQSCSSPVIQFFRKFGLSRTPIVKEFFTRLLYCSLDKNFGINFTHIFLTPEFPITILCTVVFEKFKCSGIIHTLDLKSKLKIFHAFTVFSSYLVVEGRPGC